MTFAKKILIALMFILALPVFILGANPALADTFQFGDVFAGVNNGNIQWWRPSTSTTVPLTTLNNGTIGGFTTGMAFDSAGNLLGTNFSGHSISKYDTSGTLQLPNPFGATGTSGMVSPESIAFSAGKTSFYVGDAGAGGKIFQYSSAGALMNTFTAAVQSRGTDWLDLAADNHTLFYTSEGTNILRFDTATSTQLTNFNQAALPGGVSYALRILPTAVGAIPAGSVLVADTSEVTVLDPTGVQIAHYAQAQSAGGLFSLNLDPNGKSFWTGDFDSGKFYEFDIATGALLQTIDTGVGPGQLFGLVVFGERTVVNPVPVPPTLLLFGSGLGLVGLAGLKRRLFG